MNKALAHLHTINKHKVKVTWLCFRCHLYKQGLLHDLSKYSYIELKPVFIIIKDSALLLMQKKKKKVIH